MTSPTPVTLEAYSSAPETAGVRITGRKNTTYSVHAEASRDGLVFGLGDGDVDTDRSGNADWNEFGVSDGSGTPYLVTFFVEGVEATVTVEQNPPDTGE